MAAYADSPPPAGIRTFLIADVRGYTRFTADRGDEAASRLAAKFAEVAGEGGEAWGVPALHDQEPGAVRVTSV